MTTSNHAKYIVSELKSPYSPEELEKYATFGKRILWMDESVVEGAFQLNCSWYLRSTPGIPVSHSHDYKEIIGFIGSNPDDPYDLGGEIEFWLEDEKFIITRTAMIFVPPNMEHCPLRLLRVDRPIFHFTTVTGGIYEMNRNQQLER